MRKVDAHCAVRRTGAGELETGSRHSKEHGRRPHPEKGVRQMTCASPRSASATGSGEEGAAVQR
eukprot:scaffold154619_cov32-Tisochrysis_lutea.AAC.1